MPKLQSQKNDEDAEKILFCCCNKENCNDDFAWEPGTVDHEDKELTDDPDDSGDDGDARAREEELVIMIIMAATVLCGVTVLAAVLLLVIHSIKSRSESASCLGLSLVNAG